jgi:dsDNA-binding SOS-regulon protein
MNKETNEEENLQVILKEQANVYQEYCNFQTLLQNALVESSRNGRSHVVHQQELLLATQNLSDSTERVQENFQKLSSCRLSSNRNKQEALDTHVARSKRVLETIYNSGGKLHPLGIPTSKDNVEIKTVALATLRASIAQVEKALAL